MLAPHSNSRREPLMSREEMKALTQNTLVPVGAVLAAVVLTIGGMGYFNGQDKAVDAKLASFETRMALVEADNKSLHANVDGMVGKMDQLINSVNDIKVRLGVPSKQP